MARMVVIVAISDATGRNVMTSKNDLLFFSKIIAATQACEVSNVVLLTYAGGHRIAKGEALLREIADGGEAREVGIARIAVRDLGEAHAIQTYLAAIAA